MGPGRAPGHRRQMVAALKALILLCRGQRLSAKTQNSDLSFDLYTKQFGRVRCLRSFGTFGGDANRRVGRLGGALVRPSVFPQQQARPSILFHLTYTASELHVSSVS